MDKRWVMNASPVILLAKAEVIQFVPQVCGQLVIPEGTVSDVGRAWLAGEGARFVKQVEKIPELVSRFGLGLGETQVLAAARLGLTIVGSLRVLIVLKERKLIPTIRLALEKFREAKFYFSEALIQDALKIAGEI